MLNWRCLTTPASCLNLAADWMSRHRTRINPKCTVESPAMGPQTFFAESLRANGPPRQIVLLSSLAPNLNPNFQPFARSQLSARLPSSNHLGPLL